MFLSVVICTHRRADSLAMALESLVCEQYLGDDWEVLVVENDTAASEEVSSVIECYQAVLPLRWCLETVPNLSRARNLGAQEAVGEYLAYIDDDVEVVKGWLTCLMARCRQYHPDICGGPSYPLFRTPKPYWYREEWGISCYYGDEPIITDLPFSGMNFIVRRELVKKIGGFREDFGMVGKKIAYGEETDLQKRARVAKANLNSMYFPDVAVLHEVRPVKMTIRWCTLSVWAAGKDWSRIRVLEDRKFQTLRLIKHLVQNGVMLVAKIPVLLAVMLADIFRPGRSVWRRYCKEAMLGHVFYFVANGISLRMLASEADHADGQGYDEEQ